MKLKLSKGERIKLHKVMLLSVQELKLTPEQITQFLPVKHLNEKLTMPYLNNLPAGVFNRILGLMELNIAHTFKPEIVQKFIAERTIDNWNLVAGVLSDAMHNNDKTIVMKDNGQKLIDNKFKGASRVFIKYPPEIVMKPEKIGIVEDNRHYDYAAVHKNNEEKKLKIQPGKIITPVKPFDLGTPSN